MVTNGSTIEWQQGQDALRDEVARVTALLRSIRDPAPHAVGQWNLGEVAMHLSQIWVSVPGLARQDLSRVYEGVPSLAGVAGDSLIRDMWDLADTTTLGVKSDPERDLTVLADRIETRAQEYFSECAGADPDAPRPWIVQGVTVRQSILTYHLLSETVVHAYDIAHAAGRTWPIEPTHAAMALGQFLIPAMRALDARTLVNGTKAAGLQATYDLRIRGGDRFHFIFNDGALSIVEPSCRRVDCHISADPPALLKVVWNRQSQWPAIATGKLIAWGRKPWLGLQLRGLLRNP
ncbi:MAG TPA: maleylpyruvate isomerase N-terminal domain-containing protein [Pseudonocardiaceae bacterium]|nr:maleylpyruvate isomerase N-terminal domain-containing protein [Pseudonocardiaceae bacterium]